VSLAATVVGEALATETRDRGRYRRRIRLFEAPRPLPTPQESNYLHHPPYTGRRPLRTGSTPQTRQIGRPRLKGERLPNLSVIAEDPNITWKPIAVANWYGKGERTIEAVSDTAVWHSTGLPAVL
jgi:hypothetical protein